MPKIIQLDRHVADLIAAGEVVERPASAVKELVENSIDAGAKNITIELQNGGMTFLRITDDGCGMAPDDAHTAFLRHATSKIRKKEDLACIGTLGFRGEALAAISAVSKIDLLTRAQGAADGVRLHLEAGKVLSEEPAGCPCGTTILVRELFYNTPARMKFMKSDAAEASAVFSVVQQQALAHPEISFRFLKDGQEQLHTDGQGDRMAAIYAIYGRELANNMLSVDGSWEKLRVRGFVTRPTATRGNRAWQSFFVNNRYIKSRLLSAAVEEAYRNQIMVGRFPACVLEIDMPVQAVDVNVHPAKTEVKFLSEREVFDAVHYAVLSTLNKAAGRPEWKLSEKQTSAAQPQVQPHAVQPPKPGFYQSMQAAEYRRQAAQTPPPKPARPDFLETSAAAIVAAACEKDLPVAQALGKTVAGVGPVVVREAVCRALGETPALACDLTAEEKAGLAAAIDELKDEHAHGGTPTAVRLPQPDGAPKPVEFSFFVPQQYGSAAILTRYPSYSEMLEDYYATKDRAERLRQKSRELYKAVHNMYDRAVRKQAARKEELSQSAKADTLRLYGELLQANLWAIHKGDRQVTVQNYYTGEDVTIRLDPRLGGNENAQKYFRDYKKKQTAHAMLQKLLVEGEAEIEYLRTVLYEVESAPGEMALNEIRAELKSQGYLKYYKQRNRKQKPADFLRYTSSDGFEILVGRNNLQNDKLTLHTARGKDLWFHVQKAPGSHCVVMSRGEDIPDTTKQEAAELAVLHSSQNGGAKVAVDTTEVKNIWKANGAKPGMVLYEVYTTVYVTPREGLEEQLKKR